MSKYTAELRELIFTFGEDEVRKVFEQYELSDYLTPDQLALVERNGVWKKSKLTDMIIDEFYMREIGTETFGMFKRKVRSKMQQIFERYAPIIYSSALEYNPLVNVDIIEEYSEKHGDNETANHSITNNGTAKQENETSSTNETNGLTINSDTPQNRIKKADVLAGDYASSTVGVEGEENGSVKGNAQTETENTENGENTRNSDGTKDYTLHRHGNDGVLTTGQKLVQQYRNIIFDINTKIISEMQTLFMGLY